MWTGRRRLRLALAILLLAPAGCGHRGEQEERDEPVSEATALDARPQTAWWVDARFPPPPDGNLATLDAGWSAAALLTEGDLRGRIADAEIQRLRESPFRFELRSDVKPGGSVERIGVGTYTAAGGGSGRFLVVFEDERPVWHYALAGEPGFSALLEMDGKVRWYQCMECGDFYTLGWGEGGYALE